MSRSRSALAALVVAALLGACSDDDPKPDIPDPTSSASTSSATVSTSPTVTPTAALGPEETVRAWVAARNAALQDGDTAQVRALSAKTCGSCEQHIKPIEDVYAAGGSFQTSGWMVDQAKVTKEAGAKAELDVAMTMAAGQTVQEAGAKPTTFPEDHRLMFFRLTRASGTWQVSLIGYYS